MKKQIKVFKGIIKSIDEANHTATVTVSTSAVDRDQEVVLPSAFKNRLPTYLAHPIMLASHNPYELENQIGEAKDVQITDTGLDVTFEWYAGKGNPQADWGWFLATRKIAAFSVGMMVHGYEQGKYLGEAGWENGIRGTFTDVELLEISQVLIPSNRDAMQARLGKAKDEEAEMLELAVKSIKDEEWQAPAEKEKISNQIKEIVADVFKQNLETYKEIITDIVKDQLQKKSLGEGPQALPTPTKAELKAIIDDILKTEKLI